MSQVENRYQALSEITRKVYGDWAQAHADGEVLTVRDYDAQEQYQRPDLALFEAQPDLEKAMLFGMGGMGEDAYQKLGDGYDDNNVLEIVHFRHQQGKSTLIPTLHIKNVFDTAMTHNRLFTASGGDPGLAEINDLIVNPMMSRLNIAGRAVMKVLNYSGAVVNALPAEGARKHGMSEEDAQTLERFYAKTLARRLGDSRRPGDAVAVHWSLTGTRGVEILTSEGKRAKSIKRVEYGIAKIVVNRTGVAVPVPMDVEIGDCKVEVLKPRALESVEDVHRMMEDMVEVASDLSGERIYYGIPTGARIAS